MQTAIHKKVAPLNERALQRRNAFPNQKVQEDVRIDEMKEQMYEQITEDLTRNSKEEKRATFPDKTEKEE